MEKTRRRLLQGMAATGFVAGTSTWGDARAQGMQPDLILRNIGTPIPRRASSTSPPTKGTDDSLRADDGRQRRGEGVPDRGCDRSGDWRRPPQDDGLRRLSQHRRRIPSRRARKAVDRAIASVPGEPAAPQRAPRIGPADEGLVSQLRGGARSRLARACAPSTPLGAPPPTSRRSTRTVTALQGLYRRSVFPTMQVTWGTYPDNRGH